MPFHSTIIFTLAHLLPLSLAHLPQQKKHHLNLQSSIRKALLTHTLASFWRKQSCKNLMMGPHGWKSTGPMWISVVPWARWVLVPRAPCQMHRPRARACGPQSARKCHYSLVSCLSSSGSGSHLWSNASVIWSHPSECQQMDCSRHHWKHISSVIY